MTKTNKSIHGLPAKSYTDQQFWEIECNTVLADGWLFAPDGEILETPGEDPNSKPAAKLRKKFKLGAYPVFEFNGLVFAYMGPSENKP